MRDERNEMRSTLKSLLPRILAVKTFRVNLLESAKQEENLKETFSRLENKEE
ncbi:MAG: hypothetical protein K9N09_04495 [Candidatus Cloacimonetes bacterium]|nr:hypothetical protein [Candidatus Cloacimonadota bacterium]MCF7814010.1 hypothetical protein [Candidatus Cloacimonadota bacterium]MCF7867940.1 hypothetical protein [Candidatus Cloacimonadota bacterium]MCF7882867.1 hypothetical protein [Candidatus Cloacimonadota bacterium]